MKNNFYLQEMRYLVAVSYPEYYPLSINKFFFENYFR